MKQITYYKREVPYYLEKLLQMDAQEIIRYELNQKRKDRKIKSYLNKTTHYKYV